MTLARQGIAVTLASITCVATLPSIHAPAHASPVATGGGLEYAQGAGGEITRTGHAFVAGQMARVTVTLAGARYDDNLVGSGGAGIAAVAVPVTAGANWHAWGARFVGDEAFRAWRVRTGPQWTAGDGRSVGLFYTHWDDNAGGRANGALAELGTPIARDVRALLSAGYAALQDDLDAAHGAVGLAWSPRPVVELAGDVGFARNGSLGSQFSPAGAVGGRTGLSLPLLDPPAAGTERGAPATSTDFTFTLGVRVALP